MAYIVVLHCMHGCHTWQGKAELEFMPLCCLQAGPGSQPDVCYQLAAAVRAAEDLQRQQHQQDQQQHGELPS